MKTGSSQGSHSNTSVVHMRDQRFSEHTLWIMISPLQEKQEFRTILSPNLPLNKLFWRHVWWSWKMTPKHSLLESKKDPFSRNRHILTPNRDLRDTRLTSKNNPFFAFPWSRMCTTRIQHYYLSAHRGLCHKLLYFTMAFTPFNLKSSPTPQNVEIFKMFKLYLNLAWNLCSVRLTSKAYSSFTAN